LRGSGCSWREAIIQPNQANVDISERFSSAGTGQPDVHRCITLAGLGFAGQKGGPFRNDAWNMMDVSILILHHLRKTEADEDPLDQISGTTGLAGAADTAIVLQRDRTGRAILYGRGRDVEEFELALERDPSGGWTVLGEASEV